MRPEHINRTEQAGRAEHADRGQPDRCRQRPRRPLTRHAVSLTRVGSGWMETYEAPFTIEVDKNFQHS